MRSYHRRFRTPYEQAVADGLVPPPFDSMPHPPPLTSSEPLRFDVERKSPELGVGQRGLILAPPVRFIGHRTFTNAHHDRSRLQAALLFWDAVDCPRNAIVEIGDPGLSELEQLGAITRSMVYFSGTATERDIITSHLEAFKAIDATAPGRWSLGSIPGGNSFEAGDLIENGGISVTLTNAIPLPAREVPFEDVLEFREHRRPELLALRAHLDQIAHVVATSPDSQRALVGAVDELDRSIAAQIRVTNERFGLNQFLGFDFGFNIADAVRAGLAPALAGPQLGLSLTSTALAAIGAAAWSGISLEARTARRGSPEGRPFEYVVNLHNELG